MSSISNDGDPMPTNYDSSVEVEIKSKRQNVVHASNLKQLKKHNNLIAVCNSSVHLIFFNPVIKDTF